MNRGMLEFQADAVLSPQTVEAYRQRLAGVLTRLYGPEGASWLTVPPQPDWLPPLLDYAAELRGQAEVLVVLGVGGAVNLLRAALAWLGAEPVPTGGLQVLLAEANAGRAGLAALRQSIGQRRVACCVLSKSGQTAETLLLADWCREWLQERHPGDWRQRLYLVAQADDNPLWRRAVAEDWRTLPWPRQLAGRYALAGPALLLPLAAAGCEVTQILAGARQAARLGAEPCLAENPVARYGLARYLLQEQGRRQEVWLLPEARWQGLAQWLCQLFAESEGQQGRGVFPLCVTLPADLHVYGQLLQDGPGGFWCNALLPAEDAQEEMQRLREAQQQVLRQSQQECGNPWLTLQFPPRTAYGFGAAVYFFQIACAVSCGLAGLTAWQQPALDRYKQQVGQALRQREGACFGTAGLRGVLGEDFTQAQLARAVAAYAQTLPGAAAGGSVIVGYDTRRHSRALAELAARVLKAQGLQPLLFGEAVPAALVSYAVRRLGALGGLNLTASHNPPQYHGCKFYDEAGRQLLPNRTAEIARRMALLDVPQPVPGQVWQTLPQELAAQYREAVLAQALPPEPERAAALGLVYSPLFGSGAAYLPPLLRRAGFHPQLVEAQMPPDGAFPGLPAPNPELPEAYAAALALARQTQAELVLLTDADADRLGVAVRQGADYRQLNPHELGALLLDWLLRRQPPAPGQPAVLLKSLLVSPLLTAIAERAGLEVVETLTGFKYQSAALDQLRAAGKQLVLACDETYGYLRGDYTRDKDGILAGLLVVQMAADAQAAGRTLPEELERLREEYGCFGERTWSRPLSAAQRAGLEAWLDALRSAPPSLEGKAPDSISDYRAGQGSLPPTGMLCWQYGPGLRVFIRPSGTEPRLKLYAQAQAADEASLAALLRQAEALVKRLLVDYND